MSDSKCKRCRRQGEKLYLKGERCYTPKCAVTRKPYAPGGRGAAARRRPKSEFGRQLSEKQKMRFLYDVSESQFSSYVAQAMKGKGGDAGASLIQILESRLDNVVFRLGFSVSRSVARQLVSHGHMLVNGKRVFTASYRTRIGDVISIDPAAITTGAFGHIDIMLKKHQAPSWVTLAPEKREGAIVSLPKVEDVVRLFNVNSIIEYYAR
ncbi:MAG: 30S ribosomal protein S4 [Patescibacteria group bacterium]